LIIHRHTAAQVELGLGHAVPRAPLTAERDQPPGGGQQAVRADPAGQVGVQERGLLFLPGQVHPEQHVRPAAGRPGRLVQQGELVRAFHVEPGRRTHAGRNGTGVSLRQSALDPGFHCVPTRSTHPDCDADGADVT